MCWAPLAIATIGIIVLNGSKETSFFFFMHYSMMFHHFTKNYLHCMLNFNVFYLKESGSKASVPSLSKSASRETLSHQNSGGSARTPSKEVLCNPSASPGSRENTPVTTAYPRSTPKDKPSTHKSERFVTLY